MVGEQESITNLEDKSLEVIVTVQFPNLVNARLYSRARGKNINRLISGDRVKIGEYSLYLINNKGVIAIEINPLIGYNRTFWHFDSSPVHTIERETGPRIRVPFNYYLWEIQQGVHQKNTRLSSNVKDFLTRLGGYL